MRHRVSGQRLGRSTGHRNALRRSMVTDLFRHERIRTTHAKARAVRGFAERLITTAKRGNGFAESEPDRAVHARRLAAGKVNDPEIVKKLFDDIAVRFKDRNGGYTRIIKLGPRKGDGAELVILELVEE